MYSVYLYLCTSMDIHIIALRENIEHCCERGKICFGWNKEPDDDVKEEVICKYANEGNFVHEIMDALGDKVCNACLWYYLPYHYVGDIVYDVMDIWESNVLSTDSPYWIQNLIERNNIGIVDLDYLQDLNKILHIRREDIEKLKAVMIELNEPIEKSDKELWIESNMILEFFIKWSGDGIKVLYYC